MLDPIRAEERINLWLLGTPMVEIARLQGVTRAAVYVSIRRAQVAGTCPQERTREVTREHWGGHPRALKYKWRCVVCGVRGTSTVGHRKYCGKACRNEASYQRQKAREAAAKNV